MSPHGTEARYATQKCRCDECRQANTKRQKVYRMKRFALLVPDADGRLVTTGPVEHGIYTTYCNWACRCLPCSAAWSERMKAASAQGGGVMTDQSAAAARPPLPCGRCATSGNTSTVSTPVSPAAPMHSASRASAAPRPRASRRPSTLCSLLFLRPPIVGQTPARR